MKTPLRIRVLLLSLATLMLFNGFGMYVLAYAKTGLIRLGKHEGALQEFVLSNTEFSAISWIGKHDFIYKDHVYDCEKIVSADGKITITCRADEEETGLKNTLAGSFDQHAQNPPQKAGKASLKIFPALPFEEKSLLPTDIFGTKNSTAAFQANLFIMPVREIASPPPKLA